MLNQTRACLIIQVAPDNTMIEMIRHFLRLWLNSVPTLWGHQRTRSLPSGCDTVMLHKKMDVVPIVDDNMQFVGEINAVDSLIYIAVSAHVLLSKLEQWTCVSRISRIYYRFNTT